MLQWAISKAIKDFKYHSWEKQLRKTSILDAIFCFYDVKTRLFVKHSSIQKEMAEINKNKPFWVSYFHDMDTSQKMSIVIRDERSEVTQTYETETNQKLESSLSKR